MKSKKILAALMAAMLIIGSFSACGENSDKQSTESSGSTVSSTISEDTSDTEKTSGTEIPQSDVFEGETDQQTYPITDEKITLRLWYPMAGSMGELADFNDAEFFQWYEEKTNIHIDFVIPASGTEADAFPCFLLLMTCPT